MLKYLEGEPTEKQKSAIIGSDLEHLKSRALLTGVILRFKTHKTLMGIQSAKAGIILTGMKTISRTRPGISGFSCYPSKGWLPEKQPRRLPREYAARQNKHPGLSAPLHREPVRA